MIINNQNIKGIYKWRSGIIYREGDFVIYNNLLYYVTKNNDNILPPTENDKFTEYSLLNSVNEVTESSDENKLVTVEALKSVVDNYVTGLNLDGFVQNIKLNPNVDLNTYVDTAIYELTNYSGTSGAQNVPALLDASTSLFKVYKLENSEVIQEIIDANLTDNAYGSIYIRKRKLDLTWTQWIQFSSLDSVNSESKFSELDTLYDEYNSKLNYIYNVHHQCTYVKLSKYESNDAFYVNNASDLVGSSVNIYAIQVLVTYKSDSTDDLVNQDDVLILVPSGNDVISVSRKMFTLTCSIDNNRFKFVLTPGNVTDNSLLRTLTIQELIGVKTI